MGNRIRKPKNIKVPQKPHIPGFFKRHMSTRGKLRGKRRLKLRVPPRGPLRLNAVINRNVINAVYLSRYKRRNFFDKIFNKRLIQINKKI